MSSTPLILIDGSSYLYRAFHALPPLINSRGEPTGAVYGVVNMLRKLGNDAHAVVVFDAKGPTFRDALFAEYKSHRPPMPEDLRAQIAPLHEIVQALGFPLLCVDGVEADDVIGTLAVQAAQRGQRVLISTGDKDMAQLVNEHITLVNTMRDTTLDPAGVMTKFGVHPRQIIDYLALTGDSSDNIPGIPQVGPKTAAKWLQEYGTLDNLIAHVAHIGGKVGDSLRDNLHLLPLSRQLVTIHCDVPLALSNDALQRRAPDVEALRVWYTRLEFKSLLAQLPPSSVAPPVTPAVNYETIYTPTQLTHWLTRLRAAGQFVIDTETTSLDYMQAEIIGVSFATAAHEAAYVPLGHDYPGAPDQLPRAEVLQQLKPLLEDPACAKIGQNLKYDMSVLARYDIALTGIAHDTMLQSYVLDSTATAHNMDTLAAHYLNYKTVTFAEVAGKGAKQLTFNQVPVDAAAHYAAEDADITLQLHQTLWPRVQAQPRLRALYEEIELPLVAVLSRMERHGVLVDVARLRKQSAELAERMSEIELEAHCAAGQPFNLGSPKQIQELLYGKLGLPVVERTPTGQPATGESALQALAEQGHALPRLILDFRGLAKLKSTYTDKLPERIDVRTRRVHTSYHQAVAATGRLSSSDPNLQNIPIRHAQGRRIRQAFIAPPDHVILAADYSQIELRIMAHLSADPGLLNAFAQGADIHRATAAEIFGVAPPQVSAEQRRSAKAINFGLIYGMSSFGLARQLGVERSAAQNYMDLYFARYPGVKDFMERTRAQSRHDGYVETLFGRRLYLPDIKSAHAQRRQAAERAAINAPMQGTAADIIKRAMLRADAAILAGELPGRMIMQVHDELVFEIPAARVSEALPIIRAHMSAAADLRVPLVVDVGVGENWDEAH